MHRDLASALTFLSLALCGVTASDAATARNSQCNLGWQANTVLTNFIKLPEDHIIVVGFDGVSSNFQQNQLAPPLVLVQPTTGSTDNTSLTNYGTSVSLSVQSQGGSFANYWAYGCYGLLN
jgi:hypothetical protein